MTNHRGGSYLRYMYSQVEGVHIQSSFLSSLEGFSHHVITSEFRHAKNSFSRQETMYRTISAFLFPLSIKADKDLVYERTDHPLHDCEI